jgi:hypothetical protein
MSIFLDSANPFIGEIFLAIEVVVAEKGRRKSLICMQCQFWVLTCQPSPKDVLLPCASYD